MFLDMTIHDFDMACFLTDSDVEEVYVQSAVLVDPAIGEQGRRGHGHHHHEDEKRRFGGH